MKLQIVSDLHLDHFPDGSKLPFNILGDMLICAGDMVDTPKLFQEFLSILKPKVPVLYVLGNHEYFYMDLDTGYKSYKVVANRWKTSRVAMLNWVMDPVIVQGSDGTPVRIIGGTMWTDYAKRTRMAECKRHMWEISGVHMEGNLNPEEIAKVHDSFKTSLDIMFEQDFQGKTIIVTHHSPSIDLCDPEFISSGINSAFHADFRDSILKHKPHAWIYGHMHSPKRQLIGDTLCIANPYGYYGRPETSKFDPECILEV